MSENPTTELPAVREDQAVTVVQVATRPACDLSPYTTPGLPPPPGLNDLGVAWGFLDDAVTRAFQYVARLPHRADEEIARRAAVLLRAHEEITGTPVRCYECHSIYTVTPEVPDWEVAGREDGMCFGCLMAMPPVERVLEGTVVEAQAIEEG